MAHLFFSLYMIALISGALGMGYLFSKWKKNPLRITAYLLKFYTSFTLLIMAVSFFIYYFVNIAVTDQAMLWLSLIILFLASLMVYFQASYICLFFQMGLRPRRRLFFAAPLLLSILTFPGIVISKDREVLQLLFIILHLAFIHGVLILNLIQQKRGEGNSKDSLQKQRRRISWLVFGVSLAIVLSEVFFFPKPMLEKGIFLSLPINYMGISLLFFIKKPVLFPFLGESGSQDRLDFFSITKKEREVIQWLKEGLSNKEIAFRMGISENTVKNHLYNIYQKTETTNRVDFLRKIGEIS